MQNVNNRRKSWQQILKDVGSRFHLGVVDNSIDDLARLKQDETLLDYLEHFRGFFPIWAYSGSRKINQGAINQQAMIL